MIASLLERAPAKVNLTLRVRNRRPDGLHDIESLVVFAQIADELTLDLQRPLGLDVRGENARACGPIADNLVLKAAQALAALYPGLRIGHFVLEKRLPIAAGLGGGSADAGAALRLIAHANSMPLDDHRAQRAARATGADVPACLDPQPRLMRGVGDVLSEPTKLPALAAILVNPGMELPTKDVFAEFDRLQDAPSARPEIETDIPREFSALLAYLAAEDNDLETAAISLQPAVAKVLAALRASPGCLLARMSGSGPTCFGLFPWGAAAAAAADALRARYPDWWICATTLGRV